MGAYCSYFEIALFSICVFRTFLYYNSWGYFVCVFTKKHWLTLPFSWRNIWPKDQAHHPERARLPVP